MNEIENSNKFKAIQKIGVLKLLKTYNNLCRSCKIKSMAAVRRGGNALNQVYNTYCPTCKALVGGLNDP